MTISPDISSQLRERRRHLGLSQTQLARRADTSVPTVSRYENGWSRFEVATLRKLATALGCVLVVKLEPKTQAVPRAAATDVVQKLRRLFWDQRLTPKHLTENTLWVVERVIEYGDLADVRMLITALGRDEFLAHVSQARMSSERARTFWRHMLDKEGMTCTTRFSREEASTSWRSSSP